MIVNSIKRWRWLERTVHKTIFFVGVFCAAMLVWGLVSICAVRFGAKLPPSDVRWAPRTIEQTFFERDPVAVEEPTKMVSPGALKLLFQPNSDVFLAFKGVSLVKGNVLSVPYHHFQSVDMRIVSCKSDSFNNVARNWTSMPPRPDGSFLYVVMSPIDCFELRVVGISPKSVQIEKFESLEDLQFTNFFEMAALQVPYFTFLVLVIIAAIFSYVLTRDKHLPLYISYLIIASGFSLLMDGNGYSLFPGTSKAFIIGAIDAMASFAITTVAMLWLMILGRSYLIVAAACLSFFVGFWNVVLVSEAAVRATNIMNFLAGVLIVSGAAWKVFTSTSKSDTRSNAILLFTGVFLFNSCACLWILQNMSFIPSTFLSRSAIKVGFALESLFMMWAIFRSYRNNQEAAKQTLEANNKQTQDEYYAAALHFVPKILLDLLKKDDIRNIEFGSTVSLTGSIVCFDIKGFTIWSEDRKPEYILAKTNEAWASLLPIIHENKGAVVSFTGDGFLALFPNSPLDALQFLVTAMARKKSDSSFLPEFDFGMGVHYGSVVFGTVGQKSQMNLTVISDIVNTAARIEGATRDTQGMIVASGEFIEACGIGFESTSQLQLPVPITKLPYEVGMRYLGQRMFKGKHNSIELFDLTFVHDIAMFERTVKFINHYEKLKNRNDFVSHLQKARKNPLSQNPVCAHYLIHMEGTRIWQLAHLKEAG